DHVVERPGYVRLGVVDRLPGRLELGRADVGDPRPAAGPEFQRQVIEADQAVTVRGEHRDHGAAGEGPRADRAADGAGRPRADRPPDAVAGRGRDRAGQGADGRGRDDPPAVAVPAAELLLA